MINIENVCDRAVSLFIGISLARALALSAKVLILPILRYR